MADYKKILCLDFDGVIHSYISGWQGADVCADRPVSGAAAFIMEAVKTYDVQVFSSRSNQEGGIEAMQNFILDAVGDYLVEKGTHLAAARLLAYNVLDELKFPTEKPPAHITIDDRAWQFNGRFPSFEYIRDFHPWTKHIKS